MRTANIRAMMSTSPAAWPRIWAWEANFVSTEAANRIEYLQTGKVDIILANFTVTPERAEEVDFALPYMNVALGVVSPDSNVITSLDNWNADDQMIPSFPAPPPRPT